MPLSEWIQIIQLIAVGILCGFINTLAGSGSVISLPMLILIGLPAPVANGTNRIAIILQSITGTISFRKQGKLHTQNLGLITSIVVAGACIGAWLAVGIDKETMEKVIGVVLILMLGVIVLKPEKWAIENSIPKNKKIKPIQILILFVIGIYGGFIQAGMGIFMLMLLVMGFGYDLIRANAVKVLVIAIFNIITLSIFIYHDQVNWKWGLILASGNILGALLAARFANVFGPKYIRYILIAIICYASVKLLLF